MIACKAFFLHILYILCKTHNNYVSSHGDWGALDSDINVSCMCNGTLVFQVEF